MKIFEQCRLELNEFLKTAQRDPSSGKTAWRG